jgi:hypothetical protein
MDNRRTLSIIAQGAGRRTSRAVSRADEALFEAEESNNLLNENLQRRRSSARVCGISLDSFIP